MDVSAGDLPSKLYFVTSTENVKKGGPDPRGPNCFSGTFWYCWYADQGEGFHKFIIPLVSGYAFLGRAMNAPERDNFDYIGHAAPGAGLFVQTADLRVRGSNSRVWHLPSWVGDLPSVDGPDKFKADQRDAFGASMDGRHLKDVAFINCEARFTMDEGVEAFYAIDGVAWVRSAVYDPLHIPPAFAMPPGSHHAAGEDHGFAHLIGGSDFCDNSLVLQSLYAHTTDRNPLVAANNHAHINVLHYDHGRPYVGAGAGLNVQDNGGFNGKAAAAMQCNLVGSVSVRGPSNNDAMVFATVSGSLPHGSSAHAALNSCYGWPSPASQDDFFTKKPNGYMQPSLRTSAWPDGFGSNYSGVLKPCADPLKPTRQEGLAFAQLMRETVGCMPARRYLYEGGLNDTFDQIDNAIRGVVAANTQWVNTVEEAGGWPLLPVASVDPANAGDEYHAPLPMGADRDEVCLSGTFTDGSSKIGYSRLRAWVIDQYFHVMGR